MEDSIQVDMKKNRDGTYDVFISHGGSSGLHYPSLTAEQIGDNVTDLIECLEEAGL